MHVKRAVLDIFPLITSDHDDGINKSRDESKKSENEALHGIRKGMYGRKRE